MTKVITIGDLHLTCLKNYFPNMEDSDDYIYAALDKVIVYAKENGIRHLFFLGDIFHGPRPPQKVMARFIKWLDANFNPKSGLEADIDLGNHDFESEGETSFRLLALIKKLGALPNVRFYITPGKIKIEGIPFQILPWPHHVRLEGPPSVIIAHITCNGQPMNSGYKAKNSITVNPGKDVWIVGDIHGRCHPQPRFIHPGTLYQTRMDEKLPKGFTVWEFERSKKKGIKFEENFIPIVPAHTLQSLTIKSAEDLSKLVKDESICYKLFVADGVRIPSNLREKFPNIWKIEGYKTKEELEVLGNTAEWFEKFVTNQDSGKTQGVTFGLSTYLKSRGMKHKDVKLAKAIMKDVMASIK